MELEMPNLTIQDIFLLFFNDYKAKNKLSDEQWKAVNAILKCKTKDLGYHTITCKECGETIYGYNSCRNRHCPMCQSYAREKWINNESNYLLDCPYFHIVTTVPSELNEIAIYNKKEYNLPIEITAHSLRHSFATYYLMNGGDILTLKSMMGHKSLNSTSIYVHLSQDFNNLKGINYAK